MSEKRSDVTIAIVGSGGEGVVSAGEILLRAAAQDGLFGMMVKSYGPQIRGGESLAQVRLQETPVLSQGDALDALVVLSWENFFRFSTEIVLRRGGSVFHDSDERVPEDLPFPPDTHFLAVPFLQTAKRVAGSALTKNIVALGFLATWFGLPPGGFRKEIAERFAGKGESVVAANLKSFEAGMALAETHASRARPQWSGADNAPKLILTGNEAISLGALFAGVRFFAGYPITPASEIMEWMARELPKVDGVFVQAEDEIAALTMVIGASFGGVKAMTATSGPGLSLMTEAMGLAAMAELPIVIVDVQRGGPSTGIPTKTSQADLLHTVFGGHGNLPRIVLAPVDVTDAIHIIVHAFYLAEKYQLPVLVLSDQFLGQRLEVIRPVDFQALGDQVIDRLRPSEEELVAYRRFKITETGVSPITMPGMKGGMYTAAGIEHDEMGRPTSDADIHEKMTRKRWKKLQTVERQEDDLLWHDGDADARVGIVAWGSTKGVVEEAVSRLRRRGFKLAALVPRRLVPLPVAPMQAFLDRLQAVVIVELSTGQFHTFLNSQLRLPDTVRLCQRAGAAPFTVGEIIDAIKEVHTA